MRVGVIGLQRCTADDGFVAVLHSERGGAPTFADGLAWNEAMDRLRA